MSESTPERAGSERSEAARAESDRLPPERRGPAAPGPFARIAQGFSLPLVVLAALAGAGYGYATHEPLVGTRPPNDPGQEHENDKAGEGHGHERPPQRPDRPPIDPRPDRPRIERVIDGQPEVPPPETDPTPASEADRQAVLEALAAGRLDDAATLAESIDDSALTERVHLYRALTRSVPVDPHANADLVRLTTRDGQTHLGALLEETSTSLRLKPPFGEEREVFTRQIERRDTLSGDAARRALAEAFQAERQSLGETPSGLALHRLAFLAYGAELRQLGTMLLTDALASAEGGILIDLFGQGDLQRLHRARRALTGTPEPDLPPDPIGDVTQTESTQDPPPRPEDDGSSGEVVDRGERRVERRGEWRVERGTRELPPGGDPLLAEPLWQEADEAYRTGLELFKSSYGTGRMANAALRAAQTEFDRGQELLERLRGRYRGSYPLERRQQELAQLALDCMKRQSVGR